MSVSSHSLLDNPPKQFAEEPFFAETLILLRAVREHDFDTLAELCDDDFGIVDIAPDGSGVPIRTRAQWEAWFRDGLFPKLEALKADADSDSEVTGYQALVSGDLGYAVLDFRRSLAVGGLVATFDCIATIIWKQTASGWKESRWHCSVISSSIPPGWPKAESGLATSSSSRDQNSQIFAGVRFERDNVTVARRPKPWALRGNTRSPSDCVRGNSRSRRSCRLPRGVLTQGEPRRTVAVSASGEWGRGSP